MVRTRRAASGERRYGIVMRRAAFIFAVAFSLAAVVALAACSGNEESSSSAPKLAEGQSQAQEEAYGGVAAPSQDQSNLDRKIIQTASLDLQVEDVADAFRRVGQIASAAGGFVLESSSSYANERPQADITIRVPAEQYESVLEELRGLAVKVERENSKAQDVTEEYIDLQAQLRNNQAIESRYIELLDRAQNITEVLTVQDRLDQVRLEIERVQGRINAINTLVDLGTISVHLEAPPVAEPKSEVNVDPLKAAGRSWEGSLIFLRAICAAFLVVVVFLWWLVAVAVVAGIGLGYWLLRRSRHAPPRGDP
jgi:nitrate reductase NapE component